MFLRSALILLVAAAPATFAQSGKDANTFDLILNGKNFGKDTYTLTKAKSGYKVQSHIAAITKNLSIDDRETFNFTDDYTYIDATDSNQDSNVQTTWLPSKDHKDMNIGTSSSGSVSSKVEPLAGANPLLNMPAFDAGAAQAAILYIVAHPSDAGYTAWLPGYNLIGMSARAGVTNEDNSIVLQTETLPNGPQSFNVQWVKGPDVTGTLNGAPVKLNSYQMGFGKFRWTFFTDESNTLMQMNVSVLNSSYIRSKFKLDTPKAP
jgi:hypothetical protein